MMISNTKIKRHNIAGKIITEALSKSSRGAGLVNMDIGSDGWIVLKLWGGGDSQLLGANVSSFP
eukprot:1161197-Pelagomonas_calceolata.AAC.1